MKPLKDLIDEAVEAGLSDEEIRTAVAKRKAGGATPTGERVDPRGGGLRRGDELFQPAPEEKRPFEGGRPTSAALPAFDVGGRGRVDDVSELPTPERERLLSAGIAEASGEKPGTVMHAAEQEATNGKPPVGYADDDTAPARRNLAGMEGHRRAVDRQEGMVNLDDPGAQQIVSGIAGAGVGGLVADVPLLYRLMDFGRLGSAARTSVIGGAEGASAAEVGGAKPEDLPAAALLGAVARTGAGPSNGAPVRARTGGDIGQAVDRIEAVGGRPGFRRPAAGGFFDAEGRALAPGEEGTMQLAEAARQDIAVPSFSELRRTGGRHLPDASERMSAMGGGTGGPTEGMPGQAEAARGRLASYGRPGSENSSLTMDMHLRPEYSHWLDRLAARNAEGALRYDPVFTGGAQSSILKTLMHNAGAGMERIVKPATGLGYSSGVESPLGLLSPEIQMMLMQAEERDKDGHR